MNNDDSQQGQPSRQPFIDDKETLTDLTSCHLPSDPKPAFRERMPPAIPDHELLRCIGRGSYGEVWLARNVMGAYRAVKIVYRDSFESDRPYEREFAGIKKFEPISRRHESQVDILHVGRNDAEGYFYYVMELADDANVAALVRARADSAFNSSSSQPESSAHVLTNVATYAPKTLRSELKQRGRLPFEECLDIALSLTTALQHLHAHGLIHRDIKPANIIFIEGLPKLADIGLVTETGKTLSFVGTEGYLPPEGPSSAQADIFSLGKVFYEICTGKDRLEFPDMPTFIDAVPEKTSLFEFNEVLLKACHNDLRKRYATADQMHEDLLLLKAGKSVRDSRLLERRLAMATKITAVLAALGLITGAALLYQRTQTEQARRLAEENRRLAGEEARQRAQLEFQRAHEQFETGQSSLALAYLARALRRDPSNRLAAERLVSALSHRQYALPKFELAHESKPVSARFSPDGSRIVTAAKDGRSRVWETVTGKLLFELPYDRELADARFSHSARSIVTRDTNGTVQVWDAVTRGPAAPPISHPGATLAELSNDDERLATGGKDGVRIWNTLTSQLLGTPLDVGCEVKEMKFSPDGARLIVGMWDCHPVTVWDVASRQKLLELIPAWLGDLSADGSRLLLQFGGMQARVWDARSGQPISRLLTHKFPIQPSQFSPDGRRVVTPSNDQTARIWDAESGLPLGRPLQHGDGVIYAGFSANGERLLTLSMDGQLRLWSAATGELAAEPVFLDLAPYVTASAELSRDERWLLVHSYSPTVPSAPSTVRLWDVRSGAMLPLTIQPEIDFEGLHENLMTSAHFDALGTKIVTANTHFVRSAAWVRAVSDSGPSVIRVWTATDGRPVSAPVRRETNLWALEFSRDSRWVLSGWQDGLVEVWNAETGELRAPPLRHDAAVLAACFNGDGRFVATASFDGLLRIWDADTGRVLNSFRERDPATNVTEMLPPRFFTRFSPDSALLISCFERKIHDAGGEGTSARIWNVASGIEQAVLPHKGIVNYAAFSPASDRVVTAEGDWTGNAARIWDARSGQPITDWLRHGGPVAFAEFSPNGERVVTTSTDRSARIWDSRTGRLLAGPLKHGWDVLTARFSPDGSRVVTASWDQTAQIWDVLTGLPVSEPIRHSDWVHAAEFSPDGRRILTAMVRQNAQIWEAVTAALPVPDWLPRLAEALGGQRMDDDGNLHRISWDESMKLRTELGSISAKAPMGQWLHWFLDDRETRPISPSASIDVSQYLRQRLEDDSLESLTQALRLAPLNPKILSRLGRKLMIGQNTRESQRDRADWLTRLALQLAPEDPSVWWLRAEVLRYLERTDEARAALDKALQMAPEEPGALLSKARLLHDSGEHEAAYQTYVKMLRLVVDAAGPRSEHRPYLHEALRELRAFDALDAKKCADLAKRKGGIEADWLKRFVASLDSRGGTGVQ